MYTEIQVSIDKSHITTIGEKLYGESLELVRELVSNSYDADATRVWVELSTDNIKVKDDGTGMDEAGLREYFNIGSQSKKFDRVSKNYRRTKIGQFGIGKFAVLTACDRFRIYTQKNGYSAEVVFDKKNWQASDKWSLPIKLCQYDNAMGNGTVITLEMLTKSFSIPEVARFIRERLPINAPHFEIYLNKKRIEPIYIAGKHFPISVKTEFGMIQGEMTAPNFRQKIHSSKVGVEVTVNGVVIRRETFEMETQGIFVTHKLFGRIAADFLPITSDRSRFLLDSPEYSVFFNAMQKEIRKISNLLGEYATLKSKRKADEMLKDTMHRIGRAIKKNPAFSPKVMSPTGEIDDTEDNPNSLAPEDHGGRSEESIEAFKLDIKNEEPLPFDQIPIKDCDKDFNEQREAKAKKVRVKNLAGKMMVARKIKIGGLGIVCNVDGFGKNEKPVFVESGIIYINQDHPLYKKQEKNGKESLSFYLAYLLSQQIALMLTDSDPYKAFSIQNKLLADSF